MLPSLIVGIFFVDFAKLTGTFREIYLGIATDCERYRRKLPSSFTDLFFSNLLFMLTEIFHERFYLGLWNLSCKDFQIYFVILA